MTVSNVEVLTDVVRNAMYSVASAMNNNCAKEKDIFLKRLFLRNINLGKYYLKYFEHIVPTLIMNIVNR